VTEHKPTEQELQLQLETVRSENLQAQERLAQQRQQAAAVQKERQEMNFQANLKKAIAGTGLKTHSVVDEGEFLTVVRSLLKFDIRPDGSFDVVDEKGKAVNFVDAFKDFASNRLYFFDGRTTKNLTTPPDELSKSTMTTAEKSAYITKFGGAAFEALQLYPKVKVNLATILGSAYAKLSPPEKAGIIEKVGEAGVSEILRRR